jgi:hypothetical protein
MNRTKLLIGLNLFWAAIAVAAYLFGRDGRSGNSATEQEQRLAQLTTLAIDAGHVGGGGPVKDRTTIGNVSVPQQSKDFSAEGAGRTLEAALADLDPIRRKLRVAELLNNLNEENLPAVLEAFENAPKNDSTGAHFRDFLYAWGRISGDAAMEYVSDPESKRKERSGVVVAISGWAAVDPLGAKDYVAKVEKKETREWMHYGVMQELLKTDLNGAIAYSEQNTKSRARGEQMERIVATLAAQQGIAGVQEWLDGIDQTKKNDMNSYKQYAAMISLDRMAAEDPQVAADWIEKNAGEPYLTSDSLERAARRAAGPINKELDWLASLPEVDAQRHAIGERFEDYIREDFEKAGEWLASQPLGPSYDEAIEDYARSAIKDNAEAAIAWAGRITGLAHENYSGQFAAI